MTTQLPTRMSRELGRWFDQDGDGVLIITLPKSTEARPDTIPKRS
jgi:hypothetical protein